MVWGGGCVALLGNIGESEAHMCSLTTTAGSGRRNWSPSAQLLSADPQTGSWNIGREFRVENWCQYGFQPFTLSPWSSLPPSPDQWVFLTRQKNKNIAIEGDYGQWCGESGTGEGCKMVPIISGGNWNHVKVRIIKTTMLMKRHLWVCLQQRVLEHNEPAPFFFQTAVWRSPHRCHHCSAKIFFSFNHDLSSDQRSAVDPCQSSPCQNNGQEPTFLRKLYWTLFAFKIFISVCRRRVHSKKVWGSSLRLHWHWISWSSVSNWWASFTSRNLTSLNLKGIKLLSNINGNMMFIFCYKSSRDSTLHDIYM